MRALLLLALVGCAHHEAPPVVSVAEARPERPQEVLASEAPQRLTHVVTLGQDAFLPGEPARAATQARPAGQPVVIQNVINVQQQPTWGYGYGSYGYGSYGYGNLGQVYSTPSYRSTPVNPVTGTPPVAGDWPKPPNPGTNFR